MNKIVYNVTVSVDAEIHEEWITWMKDIHIPDVMSTGKFIQNRILRVHGEEDNGVTYAVQYTSSSRINLDEYFAQHAPRLQQEHVFKYGNKAVAFRTILEILHETEG